MKWSETPYHRVTLFGPWTPLEPPRASLGKILTSCWRRLWGKDGR